MATVDFDDTKDDRRPADAMDDDDDLEAWRIRAQASEEEVTILRRRLQESPRRVQTLEAKLLETKGQLAQAISQNEKLTFTLQTAKEHVANLRDEVEKLTQPPAAGEHIDRPVIVRAEVGPVGGRWLGQLLHLVAQVGYVLLGRLQGGGELLVLGDGLRQLPLGLEQFLLEGLDPPWALLEPAAEDGHLFLGRLCANPPSLEVVVVVHGVRRPAIVFRVIEVNRCHHPIRECTLGGDPTPAPSAGMHHGPGQRRADPGYLTDRQQSSSPLRIALWSAVGPPIRPSAKVRRYLYAGRVQPTGRARPDRTGET